jgi:8-oxo-dGTP pyrophosphatase MutT (NUDIX family)
MVREDHGDGPVWVLPGGQVDPGELVHQAVVRELREETGLEAYGTGGARLWLWPDGTDGDPLILPAPGPR